MNLRSHNDLVTVSCLAVGLILITIAYCCIYLVVRYHQNQIHGQNRIQNDQAMQAAREKKSALNAFYVYIVSLVCFTPNLFAGINNNNNNNFINLLKKAFQLNLQFQISKT